MMDKIVLTLNDEQLKDIMSSYSIALDRVVKERVIALEALESISHGVIGDRSFGDQVKILMKIASDALKELDIERKE